MSPGRLGNDVLWRSRRDQMKVAGSDKSSAKGHLWRNGLCSGRVGTVQLELGWLD